jgi:hypothetical protein
MMKLMLRCVATLALASSLTTPCAEGLQGSAGQGARIDREMREREQRERDFELQLKMVDELRKPVVRREPRQTFALVRDDYVHLQMVNNDLARAVALGGALDLKFVSTAAAEIKKRAARLQTNLALPLAEQSTKRPKTVVGAETAQLKSALATLDKLILGFVRNPVFTRPTVVDLRQSAEARLELEEIIELSGQVKRSSEQLDQATRKSH